MKILIDMNIPYKYTSLLMLKSIGALRWSDVGSPDATDMEIMSYARDNDFIVLTYDLDFGAIFQA